MTIVYLAGPLFTLADQEFNKRLAQAFIEHNAGLKIILPQERAKKLLPQENGLELVFRDCLQMIDASDIVVSILDGPDADSGTCIELGYAHAHGKIIIGVRTDLRASEDRGLNLMVSHVCHTLLLGNPESISALAAKILAAIQEVSVRPARAASMV